MSEHRWSEATASYALGILSDEERVAFEAHMAECAECRREIQEFGEVISLLAYSTPTKNPPADLKERILDTASKVRPTTRRRHSTWPFWLAAAASAALAVMAGYGFLQERRARLELQSAYEQSQNELAARDSLLDTLLAERLSTASLVATGEAQPSMQLFWNRRADVVVLAAFNLDPAPPGRTYQLWGIPEGQSPISLGTFDVPADRQATVVLPVPPGVSLELSALSAVTEEPAGGSPQPTTTPFLAGPWQHQP